MDEREARGNVCPPTPPPLKAKAHVAGGGAGVGARGRGGARVSALRERHVTTHGHMLLHDAEERSGRISGNVAVAASGSRMGCWVGEAGPGRAGGRCHHLRFYKKRVWKVFTSSGKASADTRAAEPPGATPRPGPEEGGDAPPHGGHEVAPARPGTPEWAGKGRHLPAGGARSREAWQAELGRPGAPARPAPAAGPLRFPRKGCCSLVPWPVAH